MTIRECIANADLLKPNRFNYEQKIKWIGQLEGQIYHDIVEPRESPVTREVRIEPDTDIDHVLIAPFPYDEVYTLWLQCQIDLGNMEIGKYNNDRTLFNNALMTFRDYWNRMYAPKPRVPYLMFDNGYRAPAYDGHPIYSRGDPLGHMKLKHIEEPKKKRRTGPNDRLRPEPDKLAADIPATQTIGGKRLIFHADGTVTWETE